MIQHRSAWRVPRRPPPARASASRLKLSVAVGAVRALVLIGVFHLVFHAATPEERLPTWMTTAATYPLSTAAADGLRVVAREGGERTDGLAPALRDAVVDGRSPGQDETAEQLEPAP